MSDQVSVTTQRWKPTRAGIRNIWEYDEQIFVFADGRLVLRGPNGSGKSNALALLVPFLLDGVMAANRMDSLSGGRSMKTLLLCLNDDERANRFRHEQRTGYSWLEFEHNGEYVTIGCGARASAHRDAEAWFFVTSLRPGIDLELAPGNVPLSRGALVERAGATNVYDSAETYRAAVDRALFGLGSHRYRNLIELLLVLRRPHLAGKLNLEHLSKVLSDGLAALDDQLIIDVAASFDDLEAVQRDLYRLQEAHRTVQAFLPVYRRYLRATARARALAALEAERVLRSARRRVVDAEKNLETSNAAIEKVRLARIGCDERREVAEQRQRGVLESPAYLDAKSLGEVEGRASDAEVAAAGASQRLGVAEAEVARVAEEALLAESDARAASTAVGLVFAAASAAGDQAGVAWSIARDELESDDLQGTLRAFGVQRRQDVADTRAALANFDAAAARASTAASAATRSGESAERAESYRRSAAAVVDEERRLLGDVVRDWAKVSGIAGLDTVVHAVELVGESGAPSLNDVVDVALRPRRDELAARSARAVDRQEQLLAQREDLVKQRQCTAEDPVPAPERMLTRPADRSARSGAPFYACCDFADEVSRVERAGLEAAIEAAGLLDAWIGAGSDDLDAWLVAGVHSDPAKVTRSLAHMLVATPPADSGLSVEAVQDALSSIALADAGIAVLPDGRFALGPLGGRFVKPDAEFIGATAREQRRLRVLAELDEQIRVLDAALVGVAEERETLAAEGLRLGDLVATLPSAQALAAARDALVSAVATARATKDAADRDGVTAREARQAADREQGTLREVAEARRLPATAKGLGHSEMLVYGYEQRAQDLINEVEHLKRARVAEQQASEHVKRGLAAAAECLHEHDALLRQAKGLMARVHQLRSQLGADVEAPLRTLEHIEGELRDLRDETDQLNREVGVAAESRGGAIREQQIATESVVEHAANAAESAARLDVVRRGDVWPVVTGDLVVSTMPTQVSDFAAAVVKATIEATAEPDDNALLRAYRQLLDELGRGYDPGLSYVDHVAVIEITSDAGTFSVLWLAEELTAQLARQQELLSERDREIFERHLLTRVSEALRDLLNDADELVERINRSLADRPTASGKSVQLRWEPDSADAAVRTALNLLRKTPELLGPDEREKLRRFFSTAIAQRRAEDAASGYAETLRQVLDYRTWHSFVPHVRSAGGGIQRLTRSLFRSLSGGEQAVVLHLPLFAAAAAHYDIADSNAPRLIALDEAFAGIDEGMRAELMGLLVRFDLDVVLTGHELWGAYEQVPAIMVYDLLRHPPLEGVSAFAIRWDGVAMAEV